jgi:non-specific serine/threonine protein kinase/serine/threonine-protein kinase
VTEDEPPFGETIGFTRVAGGGAPLLGEDFEAFSVIDEYKLLKKLGEGGMGQVWAAEQERPVHRVVALKLIRLGMDTAHFVARFEAERQALALMDHPAIAKVFDAGTTPDGRPYFVMELVQGVPIHQYCDSKKLDLESRIRLFIRACEGVEHAHQKAIIHRDLKPSNILVSFVDGRHLPKIIDFGVAKATGERLTERTMLTQAGSLVGTLEFMSPEQIAHSEDVDTRSDVYSLGVILYELLSGKLPFDGKAMLDTSLEGMLKALRLAEPVPPSQNAPPSAPARCAAIWTGSR